MKTPLNSTTILLMTSVLLITSYLLKAQGFFTEHTIDNSFVGACSVCSYDLNGDGKLDILAAGSSGDHIAWWKNDGNYPITFSKNMIDSNIDGIIFVDAADIEGDGDLDVLGAAWYGNENSIWKNEGGDPILWNKVVVDSFINNAHEIHGAYIDADTLLDIIAASGGDHQIIWYRNAGGDPIVWEKNVVDDQFTGARSVVSFDINNDGYNDLIGAALTANQVSIWYNSGTNPVQWSKQIVDNAFGGAHWVRVFDIDKDGDPDIIAAGAVPGTIAWWRNEGGNPIQWIKQVISSFSGALSIEAADLDLDNDIDVFSAAINANSVYWWKNNGGNPIQWTWEPILSGYSGAWPVFGVDVDEDGDTDILTTASTGNKVTWLENTTIITHLEDESYNIPDQFHLYQNYPNPFNPTTKISYQIPETGFVSIKVYDVLGNNIATLINGQKPKGKYEVEFDAIGLTSGIYYYQLKTDEFVETKKMILMK